MHRPYTARLTIKILNQSRNLKQPNESRKTFPLAGRIPTTSTQAHHFILLFRMTQSTKSTKTPRKRSFPAVNSNRMIRAATKIHYFSYVNRRYVSVFTLLDVQNDPFRTGLVIETQFRGSLKIFAIRVMTQLSVLGQTECVKTAFDVENDGKFGSATDFNDWRAPIIYTNRGENLRLKIANATLAGSVVPTGVDSSFT